MEKAYENKTPETICAYKIYIETLIDIHLLLSTICQECKNCIVVRDFMKNSVVETIDTKA